MRSTKNSLCSLIKEDIRSSANSRGDIIGNRICIITDSTKSAYVCVVPSSLSFCFFSHLKTPRLPQNFNPLIASSPHYANVQHHLVVHHNIIRLYHHNEGIAVKVGVVGGICHRFKVPFKKISTTGQDSLMVTNAAVLQPGGQLIVISGMWHVATHIHDTDAC